LGRIYLGDGKEKLAGLNNGSKDLGSVDKAKARGS
jgi:hypothetical protein